MNQVCQLSIRQLRDAIKRKDLSIWEIADAFLGRIEETNNRLNAFVTVEPDSVLDQAKELDRRLSRRELKLGFLTGIPLAIKDNIVTRGLKTTCGSRILEEYVPPYDATVIRKLKKAGALFLGKTNCDEFAMGSSTENSAFSPTRNPWDLERVPGGSSGGSAAAVSAGLAPGALGSDTGGSIRQPAAFCGNVGLKPTYGRVSRYGLVAFGSSLDQIGPFGTCVQDVATILQVLAGGDANDSTSSPLPVESYLAEIRKDIKGLRVGIPAEWFGDGLDPAVENLTRSAIAEFEAMGCLLEEVSLPNTRHAIATYYIIAPAEASSNLARYDGVKYGFRSTSHSDLESMYRMTRTEGFGDEVKRRIMIGTYVLSAGYYDAYFLKASKVRTLIKQDYQDAFSRVDLLVGPTTPSLPFMLGEKTSDPLEMYLSDVYTVTANLAGIPALSMPCGFSDEGLPVGLHILGPHFQESRILRFASALESQLQVERPPLPI
jgi:aspartyl-tRNA(Asn)/glutamyl-tRNA(Gln) amidotransferase subunit A